MQIEACEASLGAVVSGVDLNHLDNSTWRDVETAWYEFAVLIFPGQNISPAQHIALGERIGPIEVLAGDHKSVTLSNQRADGSILDASSNHFQILRGNEGWHTDSSYMPVSARASILAADVVPDAGGETEWADMRAAYDSLDDDLQRRIASLAAYHSLYHSQAKIGHAAPTGSNYGLGDQPPPLRPLVKEHPVTGRVCLFIGRHAYGIPGLSEQASETLLATLLEAACQAPRVLVHRWQAGDVVMWDNRCVLHRARPYDFTQARVLRHVRVSGDARTEAGIVG
ncbi:MAG TPA: TauD/TfdA family dioxygenase [Gammaproteobacteria bacterium]|nr:TauD/TfdA family dioxygenase [Gammaproteobacteria bacterium]